MIKKGFVVEGQEKEKVKALKKMRAMGLITIETQGFAQCPKMHAFVKMTGGFEEECPVCMQNFVPKKVKQCFVVGKVCDNKIIDYLQGLLSDFFPEQGIDDEFGVINVKLGDSQGKVVWLGANTNDVYLTPTADDFVIRIMPSLIGITRGTEDKKFIELEEIVNNPDNLKQLTQILLLNKNLVPSSEKIRLIEQKLRDLSWQKFETFVEELLTYIQNNKSKVNALLMNLESKKDSLFGSKIVKIGGASNSDLVVFSLFEYLAPLLKSNNSFEVKKYNSSTLSIGDFHEAISHASTVNKIGVIIITTTSKVSTAAWTETIRGGGVIKPIIIDKGLLIRIIDWLDAYSIL